MWLTEVMFVQSGFIALQGMRELADNGRPCSAGLCFKA